MTVRLIDTDLVCPRRGIFCEECGTTGVTLTVHTIATVAGPACGVYCHRCWKSGMCGPRTVAAATRMAAAHRRHGKR